jgi:hypothetical protein
MSEPRLTDVQQTELGQAVLHILQGHRGARAAITGAQLARMMSQRNDRAIRLAIERLIEQGHMIAASVHEPMGYYFIDDPRDAEIYEATLRSRATKTLKRLSNFRTAVARQFGRHEQMPLEFVERAIDELER